MSATMYLHGQIDRMKADDSGSLTIDLSRESYHLGIDRERVATVHIFLGDPRRAAFLAKAWKAYEAQLKAEEEAAKISSTVEDLAAAEADARAVGASIAAILGTPVAIEQVGEIPF